MKISVCMATYNGEKYLKEQLTSILKQLSAKDELIISDDGSTDRTVEIIGSISDERIKLLHSTHRNLIFNFENALNHATGDVVFLSDQDDIWFDDKVKKYKEYLLKYSLVFSNALMFQQKEYSVKTLFFGNHRKRTGLINNLFKVNFLGATLAFSRQILDRALPFPKNLAMHDIWLGLVAEATGTTYYIDEPLIYYRRHADTASTAGGKSKNSIFKMLRIRWNLMYNLGKRIWLKK